MYKILFCGGFAVSYTVSFLVTLTYVGAAVLVMGKTAENISYSAAGPQAPVTSPLQ